MPILLTRYVKILYSFTKQLKQAHLNVNMNVKVIMRIRKYSHDILNVCKFVNRSQKYYKLTWKYFKTDLHGVAMLRTVPANTEIFCKGYDYWGKADLSKGYKNLKRKMWVTTHVSKIIKQP